MEGTWSWRRGSIIASALILLAVCIVLWIILGPKCLAAVAAQPSSLLPLPFLVFVAFEMLVILQHLARILTAKLVGLKLLAFACGPFAIRRIRDRTRFTWNNRETMISGTTVFGPKTMAGLQWRCLWLIASGPASMILAGSFFMLIVQVNDPTRAPIDTLFLGAMAFHWSFRWSAPLIAFASSPIGQPWNAAMGRASRSSNRRSAFSGERVGSLRTTRGQAA